MGYVTEQLRSYFPFNCELFLALFSSSHLLLLPLEASKFRCQLKFNFSIIILILMTNHESTLYIPNPHMYSKIKDKLVIFWWSLLFIIKFSFSTLRCHYTYLPTIKSFSPTSTYSNSRIRHWPSVRSYPGSDMSISK